MKVKIAAWGSAVLLVLTFAVVGHAQAPANVAGTWTVSNQGRGGVVMSTLTIMQDGATLKGTLKGNNGMEIPLEGGTVTGNIIDFTVTRQGRGGEVKVEYKGTIDGDNMAGTFMLGQNSVDWTAKRTTG